MKRTSPLSPGAHHGLRGTMHPCSFRLPTHGFLNGNDIESRWQVQRKPTSSRRRTPEELNCSAGRMQGLWAHSYLCRRRSQNQNKLLRETQTHCPWPQRTWGEGGHHSPAPTTVSPPALRATLQSYQRAEENSTHLAWLVPTLGAASDSCQAGASQERSTLLLWKLPREPQTNKTSLRSPGCRTGDDVSCGWTFTVSAGTAIGQGAHAQTFALSEFWSLQGGPRCHRGW